MSVQVTPEIFVKDVAVRQQGRTIVQTATATSKSLDLATAVPDRDTNEKLYAIFNSREDYYINLRGAATAPTADSITGNAPLLCPESLVIPGDVTAINFATVNPAVLHIEIFKFRQ